MESPFMTTNRILNEHSNSFDILRIIAGELKLKDADRQSLLTAADELEFAQRALLETQADLIETQQRLIAVNDQLLALREANLKLVSPSPVLSAGWIKAEVVR